MVVRRDVSAKFRPWGGPASYQWGWQHLARMLRRRHHWRVEVYVGVAEDIGVPLQPPDSFWVEPSKAGALALAEETAARLSLA